MLSDYTTTFKVIFNTRGYFVKDPDLKYVGGEVFVFEGQDPDYFSFFEVRDLVKSIDSAFDYKTVKMWWKHEEGSLEADMYPFKDDGDALESTVYAVGNNNAIEIYCEAKPEAEGNTFMDNVREKGKGKNCEEENEGTSDCSGNL
ncbi:unnamed protein product [Vicia faba]|uniref:PB1-like domain-containing protein n=1 Tax=Vicia faba TaxID=3906 RepID=A0AAV0ZXN5_VICFA|nr:unnamed protein product [Vicia faba]